MKRLPPTFMIGLALFLATSCTSTESIEGPNSLEIEQAFVQVVILASQEIDANLFSNVSLETFLPREAAHFAALPEIPLFQDHLQMWVTEVQQAFRQSIVQAPDLVVQALREVVWDNPQAILAQGDRSGTNQLIRQNGAQLEKQLQTMLRETLQISVPTWALILDRYTIWQNATKLWGDTNLSEVTVDPLEHLSSVWVERYLEELGVQEERLRTTPVPKESGSFLEVFQQDEQQ